jgi:hypothetical protein
VVSAAAASTLSSASAATRPGVIRPAARWAAAARAAGPCDGSRTRLERLVVVLCEIDLWEGSVRATGAGFTKGADDGVGDWAEYRITGDPAGTVEDVEFTNDNVGYVLSMVTLKPQ